MFFTELSNFRSGLHARSLAQDSVEVPEYSINLVNMAMAAAKSNTPFSTEYFIHSAKEMLITEGQRMYIDKIIPSESTDKNWMGLFELYLDLLKHLGLSERYNFLKGEIEKTRNLYYKGKIKRAKWDELEAERYSEIDDIVSTFIKDKTRDCLCEICMSAMVPGIMMSREISFIRYFICSVVSKLEIAKNNYADGCFGDGNGLGPVYEFIVY